VSVYGTSKFLCVSSWILEQGVVAISWQERQMSTWVLWALCLGSWLTSYCNMTKEPPRINQHVLCLGTSALENGPDSHILHSDWFRTGPILYLAGAPTFYLFERTNASNSVCSCECISMSVPRDFDRCSLMDILNIKIHKCILFTVNKRQLEINHYVHNEDARKDTQNNFVLCIYTVYIHTTVFHNV